MELLWKSVSVVYDVSVNDTYGWSACSVVGIRGQGEVIYDIVISIGFDALVHPGFEHLQMTC